MASVFIDIPGVGNVEAKNAATEATLQELLKAMQGIQKNTSKKSGKGGGGDKPEADSPLGPVGKVGAAFGQLSKAVMPVIGGFRAFGSALDSLTGVIGNFANVGDSVERAAQQIPIFGGMLGTVASAAVKTNEAFLTASKSGANFGGSIQSLAASSSAAGMTMDKFSALVASNGQGMLAFGSTTESGAKRFAAVSKELRTTSNELYALGFSTEEVNGGLANYGKLLRIQGLQGTQTNSQLVAGAKNYLKEMDLLAKVTGANRADLEKEREALAKDAQLRAAMSGLSKDVKESVMTMVQSMPNDEMKTFAKDILANGTATTDANRLIMSQMPGLATELQRMHSQTQKNVAINKDQMNTSLNNGKREAAKNLHTIKTAVAADESVRSLGTSLGGMAELNTDAIKDGEDAQAASKENTDNFNKKLQESQQKLAAFSNGFQIALANSGMLDFLMKAFTTMATLVQTFVVPAFQIIATVLPYVVTGIMAYISALAINTTATFMNTVATNAEAMAKVGETAKTMALTVAKTFLTAATTLLSVPFLAVAATVGLLYLAFNKLKESGFTVGGVLEAMGDNLKRFGLFYVDIWLSIAEKIAGFFGKGDSIKAARAKIKDEQKELDDREKARDEKRKVVATERALEKQKEETAKKSNAVDKKIIDDKKAASDIKIDTNAGAESLLKQFATKEGSPLIPKDKQEATKKAENTKKEIEAKGEAKTAAEEKAAAVAQAVAEQKAKEENKTESKSKSTTQESAESLLASLNTKMDQLIKINKGTHDVNEQQLSVQKGLTSDLFAA